MIDKNAIETYRNDLEWGGQESWDPGERAWFEYHCYQGHDSSDAQLWYRSHQPVTVLGLDPKGEYVEGLWGTHEERADGGMPATYRVRFEDGHEGTAFEDELLRGPEFKDQTGYFCPPSDWREHIATEEE